MRHATAALVLLLLAGPVLAEEPPPKPGSAVERAADEVLAAIGREDAPLLRDLAGRTNPDPWIVAEELCLRGEHVAAAAFAAAAPRKDTAGLPTYVAKRGAKGVEAAPAQALAGAHEAARAKAWARVVELTEVPDDALDSLVGIRRLSFRGAALRHLGREKESADVLLVAAGAARSLGWYRAALNLFGRSAYASYLAQDTRALLSALASQLEVAEEVGDRYATGRVLFDLGFHHLRIHRLDHAERVFNRALAVFREGGNEKDVGRALTRIGDVHRRRGEYREALGRFEEALAIHRKVDNRPDAALTLHYLGDVLESLGDYPEALGRFEESLAIKRELGDRIGIAYTLNGVGNVKKDLGDYPEAIRLYRESLAIKRELGNAAGVAVTLHNIGIVHALQGDPRQALHRYEEALGISRGLRDRAGIAENLGQIGVVQKCLGNYRDALLCHEEALAIQRELGLKAPAATTLGNLGVVEKNLGNYAAALQRHEAALALHRESGSRTGVSGALANIGLTHKLLGNNAEALRCYGEAMAIDREIGDRAGVAAGLNRIGVVHNRRGDLKKAVEHFEEALEIRRGLGDPSGIASVLGNLGQARAAQGDHAAALVCHGESCRLEKGLGNRTGEARSLCNIGNAERALGNHAEALRACERALLLAEQTGHPDTLARIRWSLASFHLVKNRPEEAVAAARQGVEAIFHSSARLSEAEGASARDLFSGLFDVGYRASLRTGRVTDLLWFLERGRAASLREGLGSRAALEDAVIPRKLRESLTLAREAERQAREALAKARDAGTLEAARTAREAWEEARTEVARIGARIVREAKAASAALSDPDGLDAIRKHLEKSDALVLYGLTSEEAFALVVRRGGARTVALPHFRTVVPAILGLLAPKRGVDPAGLPALRRLIVTPLALGEDVKRVLVSPMGQLGSVPFCLLFPDRAVVSVPSGTTYGLLRAERGKRGEKVLGLGAPDYGTEVRRSSRAVRRGAYLARLTPLPGSREEVEALADVTIVGAKATEKGLGDAVRKRPRWRAVHLACHGLFDPERPQLSSLALTADAEDDGFLTALEILRMRFPSDLVVLSACETGRGRIYWTEGILGLARAFMYAGAPRVLCSLWKVDDEATRVLMVKFYELWNPAEGEGLPTATALCRAQEFVRGHEKWSHPYFWAAWVLWGLPD